LITILIVPNINVHKRTNITYTFKSEY
jgi:hypothetical protein